MKGASAFDEPVQVWNCDFTQSVVLCFSREAENKSSENTSCSSWKNTVENTGLAKCGNLLMPTASCEKEEKAVSPFHFNSGKGNTFLKCLQIHSITNH